MPLDARLAAGFSALPDLPKHRDPFDRMLIWQAVATGHILVSCDRKIEIRCLNRDSATDYRIEIGGVCGAARDWRGILLPLLRISPLRKAKK
jgi:hypothetical protein